MTQPAIVNYSAEPHSVELREVPTPTLGPTDVMLDVRAVGVCGSDLHMWTGHQSWKVAYPMVLGHEFSGVISEVGRDVTTWHPGDRVVSETHAKVDLDSPLTRMGLYNLDPTRGGYGAVVDGAMTLQVQVPTRILHRLPDNVPFEHGALTEPCCVAYNAAIANSDICPGDRVLVMGPGPIGILSAIMAKMAGAEVAIVGLARDAKRLQIASTYEITTIADDATSWAFQGDGLGVEGIIDATGVSVALKSALEYVRPAGWITKVGWDRSRLIFQSIRSSKKRSASR